MTDMTKPPPTLEDLRKRSDEILEVIQKHDASNVRVVGSVARGEAGPESDVDFLIAFPKGKTVFDLVGLWMDMEELLGRAVSLIPDNAEDEKFMRSVFEDAVPL